MAHFRKERIATIPLVKTESSKIPLRKTKVAKIPLPSDLKGSKLVRLGNSCQFFNNGKKIPLCRPYQNSRNKSTIDISQRPSMFCLSARPLHRHRRRLLPGSCFPCLLPRTAHTSSLRRVPARSTTATCSSTMYHPPSMHTTSDPPCSSPQPVLLGRCPCTPPESTDQRACPASRPAMPVELAAFLDQPSRARPTRRTRTCCHSPGSGATLTSTLPAWYAIGIPCSHCDH